MTRQRALARRQQTLLVRSAELRLGWALQAQRLRAPLASLDRLRDGWRWLRARPVVPLVAAGTVAAVLLLLRPRWVLRWALRGWSGWQLWRRLRKQLALQLQAADGPGPR